MLDKKRLYGSVAIGALALFAAAAPGLAQVPPAPVPPPPPMPQILQNYRPVTADMLRNPSPNDWLQIRRTYDGHAYSPLAQITTANVGQLKPAWIAATSVTNGHQAPPIVNNGVMFVATPGNQVMALNAKDGTMLWRFRLPLPEDAIVLHPTSRGVALLGDKVYFAAGHAVLVAIDAKTGRAVWDTTVADNKAGYYMSLAPLVADGKVMIGTSGGERGIRGYVGAYDAQTGRDAWRAYTIPAPGEPGSETWPAGGDQWKTGGGSVWVTGNYDVDTNIAYWGTGNGGPWMGDQRPGDNLYATSTIALNVSTGKIVGHFQYQHNDSWDWDEVSPPLLINYKRNGKDVRGLVNFSRGGYLYFLERVGEKIGFVQGMPFVKQNVYLSLDPKTGRPTYDDAHKPGVGKKTPFCPSLWGGKDWPPVSYSPRTRMVYAPTNDNLCGRIEGFPIQYRAGQPFTGVLTELYIDPPDAKYIGEVQAWNVDTGKKSWSHQFATSQNWGPTIVTAGDVVFSGGTNDRKFRAFDAKTGRVLWEQITGSGITAMPATYMVDGKQYVAVQSGWGIDSRGMQGRLNLARPGQFPEVPEGGSIWVFALPGK